MKNLLPEGHKSAEGQQRGFRLSQVARTVHPMRTIGFNAVHAAERLAEPGDTALLAEAAAEGPLSSRRIMPTAHWSIASRRRDGVCGHLHGGRSAPGHAATLAMTLAMHS